MTLFRFISADGRIRALTRDHTGQMLPEERAQWLYLGLQPVDDPRLGVSAGAILRDVETRGYFLLPTL